MRSVALRVSCLGPVRRLACCWGGAARSLSCVPGFGSCAPLRAGLCVRGGSAPGGVGEEGQPLCRRPPGACPGGPEGRGAALPLSVPLPSPGGHQSRCHRRRSVHGGRGLHTAPVRVRVPTPAVVRGAPSCPGVHPPACPGHCGRRRVSASRRVAYGPSVVPPPGVAPLLGGGGEGGPPLALGGVEGPHSLDQPPVSRWPEGGEVGG